ncbi:MAG: PDZ domain-containing protein [Flavobacterium sp.]|nr:PDZ domain-containing protein [Flavobacterium sp.]
MFGLEETETQNFKNIEKMQLKGFGNNDFVEGLKSGGNILSISNYKDINHELYIVLNQNFNFSAQIGIPVNGIIGYKFFQNYLIETNYNSKKIVVYKDIPKFRKKLESKFSVSELIIEKNKPYLLTNININNQDIETKMLIDSGSGDALWLFENQKNKIKIPKDNFNDYLGRGFTGELFGKRARIINLKINQFEFKKPLTSFPDSLAITNSRLVKDREGSIGGEILKRFNVVYDYKNSKVYFNKNQNFNEPFNFNMSGIELEHDGLQWVSEKTENSAYQKIKITLSETSEKQSEIKYKFALKPVFKISNIRKNSPADLSGLKKEDTVLEINQQQVYNYTLQEINELLKSEEGKIITIKIIRNSREQDFKFKLKSLL